jgi:Uma2 family endonuclease
MGNALPIATFSGSDYLAWETAQAERHMYVRGEVFSMAGGTAEHNLVAGDTFATLRLYLKGSPCKVFIGDMRLHIEAADCYYYPDVVVTCASVDTSNPKITTLSAAKLVIEVLSPSTSAFDRGDKFADYRKLDTLEEYVLIDPEKRSVDVFRKGGDGLWVLHPSNSAAPSVSFASVGWAGTLSDLVADVADATPARAH